ncbi:MAG: hypothetical protein J2P55_10945, partial [Rhizobiales bacterium]|nr:hypothetical protein [Hyphomicrobiales bacterium]
RTNHSSFGQPFLTNTISATRTVDIYERYTDSNAAMFHVEKTFGSFSKEFFALTKPTRFAQQCLNVDPEW